MLFNLFFALLLPWIAGIYLIKNDLKLFLLVAPFAALVAVIFDVLGFHFGFWQIDPKYDTEPIAALPMYLGIYPILAGFLFLAMERIRFYHTVILLFFTLLTTVIEGIGVAIHLVHYANGWTIYWTFVSYLVAYLVCYVYYMLLKRYAEL
ncbi:CBO0543 family protein [Pseudalkalibacillus hwajinpoensis]|uniref:CBO0543 family protein n=1 Tax=Guptibacillus hwajinpoensis TaxID=208199 RepID=UPI00325B801A